MISGPASAASTRICLCSPTTHPGSFRCSLHRSSSKFTVHIKQSKIIKPSSHGLRRKRNFQPRPTRFCLMNNSGHDGVAVS
ncbi:hypothetical protein ACB098_05G074100 [Castanea mollissima]